ncbi:MAG TPA: methyltransferase domain-containing protein [Candidatus Angelobacter sp.]|nr:methyltransferase domain-containing protein [Candidatus Angelobacter sp.]
MNIRSTDFVLEIGSGNNPRARSDVLCDKAIDDDTERSGRIVADRPLVEADAERLPFADSSFDYVISAQVLEHAEDPERMLQELMRVASRGYIETPSEIAERLYGWPFHRSVIHVVNGRLMIRRKAFTPQFGQLFHVLAARDPEFRRFHLTHSSLLLVQHEWEGKIDYEIAADGGDPLDLNSDQVIEALWEKVARTSAGDRWLPFVKSLVPRRLAAWGKSVLARSRGGKKRSLREIIVCPSCRGAVEWQSSRIRCAGCNRSYPLIRDIPRLRT